VQHAKFFNLFLGLTLILFTASGCSVNPATGQKQFTALMSPEAEASVGASEHEKIVKEYGGIYQNSRVQSYVNSIGQNIAKNTERGDVTYKFFVLDSPVVNAFALPGGYIYLTRGLMAVANDEAELAGVIAHEIGHVTGRHQAARYSQGVLTQLGATVLSAAVGGADVSRAVGLGTNLYMSSYSREQEHEADELGVRYLSRAGYDTFAIAEFLQNMEQYNSTEARLAGKNPNGGVNYFATHPPTPQRVAASSNQASKYEASKTRNRAQYQSILSGMTYGGSAKEGFVNGNTFYHPELGFQFTIPQGYNVDNQPKQIVASGSDGGVIIVDNAPSQSSTPTSYLANEWLAGKMTSAPQSIAVNGLDAATAGFDGTIGGRPARVQMVAIQWSPREVFRMQLAFPANASSATIENMKRTTYSFRQMSQEERARVTQQKIQIVTAGAVDTVETLASRMNVPSGRVERFRALNGLSSGQGITKGATYKIIGGA
jgi:predicted Zn-dependent protease